MEKIKNYVDIFRGENVENFDDYAEKIMNYAEIQQIHVTKLIIKPSELTEQQ